MKHFVLFIFLAFAFTGCATIQKYVDKGWDAAKKEGQKYVDKQAGTGTFDDTMKMKDDREKLDNLLPYYMAVNKMCDEKKIDTATRDELKAQFDTYYADWKEGKIDKVEYDKKCTQCIENADKNKS